MLMLVRVSQTRRRKMRSRRGYTLVELVVTIAILVVLAALLSTSLGGCNGSGYYKQTGTNVYKCVKTYTMTSGGETTSTSKRVDLKPKGGGMVETMKCDDDGWIGIYNSATIYAQFEAGKWYSVSYTGYRDERFSIFPVVTSVSEVPDPTQ
jgi:prepilin-type N-terminal cleavage/methylation domain-containing protein